MSQRIPTTPEEAARISAQLREYEAISDRLHDETEGLVLQRPHQWADMNSELALTFADTLPELLAKLRRGRTTAAPSRCGTWTRTRRSWSCYRWSLHQAEVHAERA